jgi:hypothetical protein
MDLFQSFILILLPRAARSIFLSVETPQRLYWVGKGGKSKTFQLDSTLLINRGQFATGTTPVRALTRHLIDANPRLGVASIRTIQEIG